MTKTVLIPDCAVERAKPKAVLIRVGGQTYWVPKSCIDDDSDVWDDTKKGRGPGDLIVSDWWATKEGFV